MGKKNDSKWKDCCIFCSKDFDISNMGVSALASHVAGKKHSEISSCRKSQSGAIFFSKNAKRNTESSVKVTGQSSSSITTLDSVAILTNSPCGEIFWTLKVVASHFSLCSCLRLNKLFRLMFSDSRIASSFQLSKTKCEYFITYRLAPHFKELLLKDVNLFLFFVLFF